MSDSSVSIQLPPINPKQSICTEQLSYHDTDSNPNSNKSPKITKSELKACYHRTKILSRWYRKLNEYVDSNLSNSTFKNNRNNSQAFCQLQNQPNNIRKYSDIRRNVLGNRGRKRYTDFISVSRFKSSWTTSSMKACDLVQDTRMNPQVHFAQIDHELDDCNLGPFRNELEDELQRCEFEEFILLQTIPTLHLGHLYFKILKLFRYIDVTNVEGTVITLLSLTKLVKRSAEVVQAVEECNGIVILLNLLESGVVSVQLASMKLLICLCHILYLRRMAIAYGAVQLLVQLLVDPDDDIKLNAADLLALLAVLKEARLIMPTTHGIQHLVCLLNMTAEQVESPRKPKRMIASRHLSRPSLKTELEQYTRDLESRSGRLLRSVATALWRFSHSLTNQQTMQKFGILPTLTHLVQSNQELILIPVLGILHGCSTNPIFRVSIRHEGILKYLIQHMQHRDLQVKLQSTRTLFNCLDDTRTIDTMRTLGGFKPMVDLIKAATEDASESLLNGWIDVKPDNSSCKYKYQLDDNKNAFTMNLGSTNRDGNDATSKSRLHFVGSGNTGTASSIYTSTPSSSSKVPDEGRPTRSGRSPVNIVKKSMRDPEEQIVTFHLLHTLLATAWKCCVGLPNKERIVALGLCDALTILLDLLPPYLTLYYRTQNPVSEVLQKINLIEHVTTYTLHCTARLSDLDMVKRLLVKLPDTVIKVTKLLSHSSPEIVVPTIDILTGIAGDWDLFHNSNQKYGFVFVFSLQLSENKQIQQAALKCICKYLQKIQLRSSFIRSVSSSLASLVDVVEKYYKELTQTHKNKNRETEQVLAAICWTIAEIGSDSQGRAILGELGVPNIMANLVVIANHECLRAAVCHAVTKFATVQSMIQLFQDKHQLTSLISYIRLGGPELRLNATRALDMLTEDERICDQVRSLNITPILLQIMHEGPNELLEAATHLIKRISIADFDKLKQTNKLGGKLS